MLWAPCALLDGLHAPEGMCCSDCSHPAITVSDDREQYLQIADDLLAEAIEAPEEVRRSLHDAAMQIIRAGDGRCRVRECCPPADIEVDPSFAPVATAVHEWAACEMCGGVTEIELASLLGKLAVSLRRTPSEMQVQLETLHGPYRLPNGDAVCRECSEPDGWDEADGPYLHPTVHLIEWPCRTVTEVARG